MSGIGQPLRHMLQQYELQLLAARRLARFRRARRLAEGEGEPPVDPGVKRKAMVERVARELYDMMLFTGSDNPMVEKIRADLKHSVGGEVRFTYPPGSGGLRMVREAPEGAKALTQDEQAAALNSLWGLTLRAVDESML